MLLRRLHIAAAIDQIPVSISRPKVKEAKKLKVVEVVEKDERKARPSGLNTVELLKVRGVMGVRRTSIPWPAQGARGDGRETNLHPMA